MSNDPDTDRLMTRDIPETPVVVWIYRAFDSAEVKGFWLESDARRYAEKRGGRVNAIPIE